MKVFLHRYLFSIAIDSLAKVKLYGEEIS